MPEDSTQKISQKNEADALEALRELAEPLKKSFLEGAAEDLEKRKRLDQEGMLRFAALNPAWGSPNKHRKTGWFGVRRFQNR